MKFKKFKELYNVNLTQVVPALKNAVQACPSQSNDLFMEAVKISECAFNINTVKCNDCGTNHFKGFVRCKSKFCAMCNKVKASMWTARLLQFVRQWLSMGKYVVFLNLTIKDTDSLSEGLKQLQGAWNNFTNTNSKYGKFFHNHFPGGFKSIEVKTGANSKQWHPHIHTIVLKDRYCKDTKFLHLAWPASVAKAGGYAENLKILPFKPYKGAVEQTKEEYELSLVAEIKECCKYITKINWLEEEPSRVGELYYSLKGKRQNSTWGVMYSVKEAVDSDMNTKSDEEIKDFICQVCGCTKGTPNKLYNAIWDNEYILDYSSTAPEKLASPEMLKKIKVANGKLKFNQKEAQAKWIQDYIPEAIRKLPY